MYRALTLTFLSVFVTALPVLGQLEPLPENPIPETATQTGDLYLFNDSGWTLFPNNQVITDNGEHLISLPRQTYAVVPLPPGEHKLRTKPFLHHQEVVLTVTEGSRHYVVVAYKPERSWAFPFAGTPLILKEISEQDATPLLKEMELK